METMKALVYERPGACSIRELPMPVCGEDEVIIKVMAASICKGADRRHHTTGHKLGRYPITTGHEFAGYIYKIGGAVKGWNIGDRVTADNAVPCGKCYFCKREMYTHCVDFQSVGHSIPGGFAQYVKVKDNSLFKIPDTIPFNEACMTEPVACCIHAMDRLDVKFGEDVLVFGARAQWHDSGPAPETLQRQSGGMPGPDAVQTGCAEWLRCGYDPHGPEGPGDP